RHRRADAAGHVHQERRLLRGRAGDRHARLRQHGGTEQVRDQEGHRRMSIFWELLLVVLLLTGSFFILMGGVGLVKLSEFFRRLHAPTKASAVGVGGVLAASVGYHLFIESDPQPRELLITAFLLITAPISAHLMSKAALSLRMDE